MGFDGSLNAVLLACHMPTIALLDGSADSAGTQAHEIPMTWPDLIKALSDVEYTPCVPCRGHDCEHKAGRAWLPVRLHASPCKRLDANVAAITFAVFDLDEPTDAAMGKLARALDGYAYYIHQTHRGNGYRLVLPLTDEIPAALWRDVWARIGATFQIPLDPTCLNESRLYYCPTRPEGSGFTTYTGEGRALDWQAIDPLYPAGAKDAIAFYQKAAQSDVRAALDPSDPANLREGAVDLTELRRAVGALRRPESRKMLDLILTGQRLAEVGARDAAVNQAASLIATASLGKPYPAESAVALLEGSIRAMDCEPEGLDHWLGMAKSKYLRAVARRLEKDGQRDADKAAIMRVLGREPGKATEISDDAWRRELLYTLTPGGEPGGLRTVGQNVALILGNDPGWKDTLRFNEISHEIDVLGGPLLGLPRACLDTEAANWLAASEYKLFMRSHEVGEQMLAIARRRSYDPLRDWLEALVWDGVSRVPSFFAEYFGAEGDHDHLLAVSQAFLISCVARAMQPGCEVHTVPILIGGQGVGKSRACKALGAPYFTDSGLTIGDKDSRMLISSRWIVELAELSSVTNADVEKVKSFVSLASDDFRPPYGRVTETFPRRCVFIGTTNQEEILTDWTGNRRWWPLKLKAGFKIDVDRVLADRDQLFAQALVMYRLGQKWYLTDSEAARAELLADEFRKPSTRAEQILAWFAGKSPSDRPRELTVFDFLNTVLGVPSSQISAGQGVEVGRAARELGFTRHRKRQGGKLMWVHRTPEAILNMPKDSRPSNLEVVVQAKESK